MSNERVVIVAGGQATTVTVFTPPDIDTVAHLRAALGRIARRLRTTAAGAGLTPTQLSVLGTLAHHPGGLALAELARIEGLNPTMLSRAIGRLDELGLLGREPDPLDRRAAHVRLTKAGTELHQSVRAERTTALAETLRHLSTEHVQALQSALPALDALADALVQPGDASR
jgi:DNA-binding MarR family transcriptional regulator